MQEDKNNLENYFFDLYQRDIDSFMDSVLESIKKFPKLLLLARSTVPKKKELIGLMIKHYEERDEFETCMFLRDLTHALDGKTIPESMLATDHWVYYYYNKMILSYFFEDEQISSDK
jgi:hypothetical protein